MKFGVTPEEMGIKSENIAKFTDVLEKNRFATHDVIIAVGDNVIFEKYWEPFNKDFAHRQYSVTKSFVALAAGFLVQDGLLDLDKAIGEYFPEYITEKTNPAIAAQTVREMMTMTTALPPQDWFKARTDDRVRLYFENERTDGMPSGTIFHYDSSGCFVIGALVEKLSGCEFTEYMRKKFLNKLEVSDSLRCLKCPGGHAWSDSALICTARDLLKAARFTMNYGRWNGEQLLNEKFVREAVSCLVPNDTMSENQFGCQGYGYYFWLSFEDSFYFSGMGCQVALCIPSKDLILIYNGDNQGRAYAKMKIVDAFFEYIADTAECKPVMPDSEGIKHLADVCKNLKLVTARGERNAVLEDKINGVTYKLEPNRMGITEMRFEISGDEGIWKYTNAQGPKEIHFGLCRNVFDEFPQDGYSDDIGSVPGNRRYRCAASAAFTGDMMLLKIQIIDDYFGNTCFAFRFKDDKVGIMAEKSAEDFLDEYYGRAEGRAI